MQRTKFNFTSFIKTSAISFFIVVFFLGFSSKSFAAVGIYEVVNFQGKVVNKTAGTNVTNGNYDFTFKLFSVSSGGSVIWTENFNTANSNQLTVTDGIFRVALGSVCVFTGGSCQGNTNSAVDFNSDSLYLDITFNGETFGTRVRLTAVPYAFNAKQVNGLTVTNNGGNTLNIAANKTLTASNTLTFAGTDSTTITFQGTDTYVGRTTSDTLTNKIIGSTGLIFSGATTDINTVSNEDLTLAANGSGNFVISSDFDSGIIVGTAISTEFPLLVRSGIGNNAALAVDNLNLGDIFTASASGTTRFSVTSAGGIKLGTAEGVASNCLLSGGAGAASTWGSCGGGSQTPWTSDIDADGFSLLDLGTNITARGALTIASTGSNTLTLDSGNNIITFAASDTTLTASGIATVTLGTSATINAGATALNLQADGTPDVNIAGGSGTTGCTIANATGNLTCSGTITGTGATGYWTRLAGNLSPATLNDTISATSAASTVATHTTNNPAGTLAINTLINQTGAGTVTDLLQLTQTAGAATNALTFSGTFTKLINSTNFNVSNAGAVTAVGVNSGSGLIQGTGGLTITGTTNVNATGTSASNIGNSTGVLTLASGGTSGWTNTSGNLTIQTATTGNVVIDSVGSLSLGATNSTGTTLGKATTTLTVNPTTWTATPTISGLITASTGLTVTAGQNLTVNSVAFDNLQGSGLTVSTGDLSILLTPSGVSGASSSNSGLEVSAAGLTLLKGCTDGQLLEYTDAGGWACATDDTGAGGGGSSNWTVRNGALKPNNDTLDILFGGTSTSSAKFAFMNMDSNSGLDPLASFSGNLMLESRPNSTAAQQTTWTKISQTTPGTIMSAGTANISSISAMTVYNGSLYVGTFKGAAGAAGEAEVYRYKGTNTSWERVSSVTPGTIGGTGTPTSGIASVSAMTVFDGSLYIGTSKMNQAEIYRYNGGTTWVKVSNGTAGTIGPTASIDGVSSMAVYQGNLYAGTREHTTTAGTAQLFRFDRAAGATAWTAVNTTAGTFVATNTVGVWAVSSMVVKNGYLYLGVLKPGDADVLRYQGGVGSVFLSMNLAVLTGSYLINGTAVIGFNDVPSMAVYNGSLVVGLNKLNGAEVLMLSDGGGTQTVPNSWIRLNNVAGTMTNGGTASIDGITSMAVYNGSLYVGTLEANSAEIYRYTGESQRFFKVSGAAGTIATGDTSAIDGVVKMIQANGDLIAATLELGRAEIYKNTTKPIDSSYALQFHAKPSIAGGEQNSISNYASIFFMASASANLGSNAGNGGAFIFSHGIQTKNGSYDIAEDYPTRDDGLEPGDLVAIDTQERGFVKRSIVALDAGVIGVYSEKPALRLTQEDVAIDGGRAIPVALAGRVPVKVSTQNGKIKPGDYLTASSIAGVAMKATKAGNVVGQAMAGYDQEGIGRIVVYVRSNSYSGTAANLFEGIDSTAANFEQEILAKLNSQTHDSLVSEINTDRIVAGLEIITPRIVTDELIVKKIKAEQIEGLEIITGKLSIIDSNIASLSAIFKTNNSTENIENINEASKKVVNSTQELVLAGLSVEGIATISADLRVKGSGLVEGIFSIVDTLVTNNLIANGVSNFFADVIFKGNVIFEQRPTFNNNTGGFAVLKKDAERVEVVFDKEYEKAPVISTNITFDQKKNDDGAIKETFDLEQKVFSKGYSFIVVNKSTKGFTIVLNKKADDDVEFSWIALAIKDTKISFSKEVLNLVQQVLSPTPSISASNSAVQNEP